MEPITATIRNWTRVGQVIYGQIYNDTRGRFEDGTDIRTSRVEEISGNFAYTQNSTYLLEDEIKQ